MNTYTGHASMSLFEVLFGRKKQPLRMEHPVFGTITYSKHDGWINEDFTFDTFHQVELLIDSGPEGPTESQVKAFERLTQLFPHIRGQAPDLFNDIRREWKLPPGTFVLTGISVPSLRPEPSGQLWTLWFDCVGEDHFWYGLQSDDDWKTIHPFTDD